MTRRTKKVGSTGRFGPRYGSLGSTGRFGPRYGSQLKKRVLKIENDMNAKHRCPTCASLRVKRKSVGIWHCKKCNLSFAGGAWIPVTPTGRSATRATVSLEEQRLEKSKK
ncbi:MAG: 50S ribosomal protein L37ae [Candidatus Heimdallarchaeota archaeon]